MLVAATIMLVVLAVSVFVSIAAIPALIFLEVAVVALFKWFPGRAVWLVVVIVAVVLLLVRVHARVWLAPTVGGILVVL